VLKYAGKLNALVSCFEGTCQNTINIVKNPNKNKGT